MKISIKYDSIWQNSFLKESNQDFSKDNQGIFHASSKVKEQVEKKISKNTVIGVLCRLIGDQRKLYQIQDDWNKYLPFQIDEVFYKDTSNSINKEVAFIINKGDKRPAQTKFLGVLPDDIDLFFSDTAPRLWSVLYLGIEDLLSFILSGKSNKENESSMPRDLLFRIDEISNIKSENGLPLITIDREVEGLKYLIKKKNSNFVKTAKTFLEKTEPTGQQVKAFEKATEKHNSEISKLEDNIQSIKNCEIRKELDKNIDSVISELFKHFPDEKYIDNGRIFRLSLYAASLYLQAERMQEEGYSLNYCMKTNGKIGIQGFSKRGFNGVRDFLNKFAGSKKKTVGTPYHLTKASGGLEIVIDIDREKAKELKQLIENAGVSSFFLGKKGLAYVTDIDTRRSGTNGLFH